MVMIRILASESNKKGDLFGKLISDVFLALGYEDLRFNIHRPGREIDVEGVHRAEARRVVAECKATSRKIGGDDINKFVGSADAEKREKTDYEVSKYFVSLAGFTETAIEQEKRISPPRVILFDADRVIQELVTGRIVSSPEEAAIQAGKCVGVSRELKLKTIELLAHNSGWIWCLYFEQQKRITHFSLIHADGEALGAESAASVVNSDNTCGGYLHTLSYLPPPASKVVGQDLETAAKNRYFEYLAADFGDIELTGLPADQEVGTRRMRLENLFVPLHLLDTHTWRSAAVWSKALSTSFEKLAVADLGEFSGHYRLLNAVPNPYDDSSLYPAPLTLDFDAWSKLTGVTYKVWKAHATQSLQFDTTLPSEFGTRRTIGDVLSRSPRLAILAPPGGGKSTLLKRLATAYAFPERFRSINDELPDRSFIPIIFRCRQLAATANATIDEILRSLAKRAEMDNQLSEAFGSLVSRAFRKGDALLLVDGLDEMSDEGIRVSFARQLRIFASIYPKVSIVVTSREAGFRAVAAALSSCCETYTIDELNDEDIERLTLSWHKEVVGDRGEVALEAKILAKAISTTERVHELAKNPLLLTTLLLVKRWVGQLPTRRSVLYGKAIEVLLMTWNVEGHAPLDQEEVIPQLAYVAFTMMKEGIQRITSRRLQDLLTSARQQMPEVLSFAKLSVSEFIDRVELRSSLLIQNGHEIESGKLLPVYEFRHLTFQEYLTALAVVEGYYPGGTEHDNVLTALESHLSDQGWGEVVPLAAVLSGRRVQPLIQRLVDLARKYSHDPTASLDNHPAILLAECLADECAIAPNLLTRALEIIALYSVLCANLFPRLVSGKYKDVLEDIVQQMYSAATSNLFSLANAFVNTSIPDPSYRFSTMDSLRRAHDLLNNTDKLDKSLGALLVMRAAVERLPSPLKFEERDEFIGILGDNVVPLLFESEAHLQFAASWAFVWLSNAKCWSPERSRGVLRRLTDLWTQSPVSEVRYAAAWALSRFPLVTTVSDVLGKADERLLTFLKSIPPEPEGRMQTHDFTCSCVVGFYLNAPWSPDELRSRASTAYRTIPAANPFEPVRPRC